MFPKHRSHTPGKAKSLNILMNDLEGKFQIKTCDQKNYEMKELQLRLECFMSTTAKATCHVSPPLPG